MLNAQFIMLISIFCFSLGGYFSSLVAIHLLAISLVFRFLVPTLFSFVNIHNLQFIKSSSLSTIGFSFAQGLVIFISQYFLFLIVHTLGLAPGLILYNLGPIFLIIFFTLMGNSLKVHDVALVVLCFAGMLVFFDFEFKAENIDALFGIASAILYAVAQCINARMSRADEDPKRIILWVNFAGTIVAGIYLFYTDPAAPTLSHVHLVTIGIITAMGLTTYLNQYLKVVAYKLVENPNSIVYLTYFCIPFSLVFTFLEGKTIAPTQIYGSLIILAGAFGQVYLMKRKAAKASIQQTETIPDDMPSNELADEKA